MRVFLKQSFYSCFFVTFSLSIISACGDQSVQEHSQVNSSSLSNQFQRESANDKTPSVVAGMAVESAAIDNVPFVLPGDEPSDFSQESDNLSIFAYAWPANSRVITSYYGPRKSPCKGCSSFHRGVDIGIGTGSSVYAINAGTVSGLWDSCAGNMMRVTQGNVQTRYFHLSSFLAAGKVVSSGRLIAKSGGTGSCTTGPHLHFEFLVNGERKNPLNYVK